MRMEESKMENCNSFKAKKCLSLHDATGLRKYPTEATDLWFPWKVIINYNTKPLDTVSLPYVGHRSYNFQVYVWRTGCCFNIIYAVLLQFIDNVLDFVEISTLSSSFLT